MFPFFYILVSEDIQSLSVSTNQTQSSSLNNTKETDGCNCRTTTLESHEHTESCAHHSGLSGNDETGLSFVFIAINL